VKKIRILTIVFEPEIKGNEVQLFRGAVIAKAGRDCILFHNHKDDKVYNYRYPLIQYKRIRRHATIVCIEKGVDEIHRLFSAPDWKVRIGREEKELKILKLDVKQYTMNVWDKMFNYRIFNWLALNEENYKRYMQIESLSERIEFLEKILTANILSFAKGVGWTVPEDKEIKVKIMEIQKKKIVKFRRAYLTAFDVDFQTNVFLPENISLGKAASHGFGMVRKLINDRQKQIKHRQVK